MQRLLGQVSDMGGMQFNCTCGKHHAFNIEHIHIGSGILSDIVEIAAPFKDKTVFLYGDQNTYAAAGERVEKLLCDAGFSVQLFTFQTGDGALIPDERALGRLLMEIASDIGLIIGVGSGSLNDLGKYLSAKTGIPYAIVCSAPSMDGYLSDSSAFIIDGRKVTLPSTLAYAVLGDMQILKAAPDKLLQAGFGDLVGKLTALADWLLARDVAGEAYCQACADLVQRALIITKKCAGGIKTHDEAAIADLFEGLLLTGVAMCLMGITRPASGAEHMLSHFWEMDFLNRGEFPELHGIKVGVATPVVAQLFSMLSDILPQNVAKAAPTREEVEALLTQAGAPVYPLDGDVDRQLFYQSILGANTVRKRYSILQFAIDNGRIEQCAKALTEYFYGKGE